MTTTDIPQPKLFMRRAALIAWLAELGFRAGQVDQMIRDGVIPRAYFPTTADEKRHRKPRAYYRREAVAAALNIPLPSPTTTPKN